MYGVWYNYLIEKLNFSNELVNILKKIGSYLNYLFINRFCEEGDIVMRKNDFPNDEQHYEYLLVQHRVMKGD